MNCPVCGEEMELDVYPHGFHPATLVCSECGYEDEMLETEKLKLFIEKYEVAAWSSCNSEDLRLRYQMISDWLKQLLKIKEFIEKEEI